jgi:nitrogen fixation protein NifB
MDMPQEYNFEQRQEVHAGIETFREQLEAAKQQQEAKKQPAKNQPKILVAIATKGSGLVNQHFGHAKEFQIYEVDGIEARFVGHRKIDHFCQGGYGEDATLENIIKTISDCQGVLVSKIGDCPKKELTEAGIDVFEAYDTIDKVALDFYEQYIQKTEAGQN